MLGTAMEQVSGLNYPIVFAHAFPWHGLFSITSGMIPTFNSRARSVIVFASEPIVTVILITGFSIVIFAVIRRIPRTSQDTFHVDPSMESHGRLVARARKLGLKIEGCLVAGVTVCVTGRVDASTISSGTSTQTGQSRGRRRDRIHRMVSKQAVRAFLHD